MFSQSKILLRVGAAALAILFFGCVCAEAKEKKPESVVATVKYVCPKCKSKLTRGAGQPKGFVGTCPKCGEKFLTF